LASKQTLLVKARQRPQEVTVCIPALFSDLVPDSGYFSVGTDDGNRLIFTPVGISGGKM